MAKIAISSEGPTLNDSVDPRFGRAAGFIIVDTENMTSDYIDNGASQARAHGAGIQAAETVARSGAVAVLTGYVGPKAFQTLVAAGIKVAQDFENISVKEALARYHQGDIVWTQASEAKGPRP
jgi:predicted Fe-Mo cluster-binding NifX family protein